MKHRLAILSFAVLTSFNGMAAIAETNPKIKPDLVYGHKDGLAMTMDLLEPDVAPNGACLMFIMSGGWVSQWVSPDAMQGMFQPFLQKGYKVFIVRHGSSPRYLIPDAVADLRKALQYVNSHAEENGIDPKRIGVFGFSAGGHLSLMLGTTTNHKNEAKEGETDPRVAAIAAVFAPSDLLPYMDDAVLREQFPALKFPKEEGKDHSPLYQASSDDAPTIMIHGNKDDLVPHWHSEKMLEAFKEANVPSELVIIDGAGHSFDEAGQKRTFEAMMRWFDDHLLVKEPAPEAK